MAPKVRTRPRKQAAQRRSRATVDALVEATARILVEEGFDKASTNHIAETAGVSIGSLYQYYPNKEALVVAVLERHHEALMRIVRATLADITSLPLHQGVRLLVAAAIEAHGVEPALHRVLSEQIPRLGRLAALDAYNREAHALTRRYLEGHRDELRIGDLEMATFVVATSIESLTHTAVLARPQAFDDQGSRALVDEISRLVLRYLVD